MRKLLSAVAAFALIAIPAASPAAIVINEIMYDPVSTDNQATTEYVELYNTDSTPVDLEGYRINAHSFVPFTFPADSSIAGNGYILLQSFETDTLLSLYKGGIDPAIVYRLDTGATVGSKLANGSGTITLFDASNTEIDKVVYAKTDGWPTTPNDAENKGHSLELIDPALDNADGANWLVSRTTVGTPGKLNSQVSSTWYSDFTRTPKNPTSSDPIEFTIDVSSDATIASVDLYLENLTASAGFTPIPMTNDGSGSYNVSVGSFADESVLRYYVKIVDSEGLEVFYPPLAPLAPGIVRVDDTPLSSADIVINEVMINPTGTDNGTGSEYFELFNRTSEPINLSYYMVGRTLTDSYWRILPGGTVLPANGYLVVAGRADVFRAEWTSLDPSVLIADLAWRRTGSVLVNGGSDLFLANPNEFSWDDQWESISTTPFITLDMTLGSNGWPTEAQTVDTSIELTAPDQDPTVGSNWKPSTATGGGTPGALNSTSNVVDWSMY